MLAQWEAQQERQAETKQRSGFTEFLNDLAQMPATMKQLSMVQFFSWFALFMMWIYTTSAVTRHVYGATDTGSALYNEGANWVGICFSAYNGFAAVVAFLLPVMAARTSRKAVHALSLMAGGIGLLSIYFVSNPNMLLVSMLGIGLAWASILSMPYAILAGALPASKMGIYMGIFNFFIVLPQIVASALGYIAGLFFQVEAIYALMLGGLCMFIAAAMTTQVKDVDEVNSAS
jgi:maltose/moltooligosaccharide transporter